MSQHIEPGTPCLITDDLRHQNSRDAVDCCSTTCIALSGPHYSVEVFYKVVECSHPHLAQNESLYGCVHIPAKYLPPLKGDESPTDEEIADTLRTDTVPTLDEVVS